MMFQYASATPKLDTSPVRLLQNLAPIFTSQLFLQGHEEEGPMLLPVEQGLQSTVMNSQVHVQLGQ